MREASKIGSVRNDEAAGPGEPAHPHLVLAWLAIVILAALAPALKRVLGHLAN